MEIGSLSAKVDTESTPLRIQGQISLNSLLPPITKLIVINSIFKQKQIKKSISFHSIHPIWSLF
jgi:hypothetical protein